MKQVGVIYLAELILNSTCQFEDSKEQAGVYTTGLDARMQQFKCSWWRWKVLDKAKVQIL